MGEDTFLAIMFFIAEIAIVISIIDDFINRYR